MSKGYKIYLFSVVLLFSMVFFAAWKFGVLELFVDTYFTPAMEHYNPPAVE